MAITVLALMLTACTDGNGLAGRQGSGPVEQDPSGGGVTAGAGGGVTAGATVQIGDETWELPNVACRSRTGGTMPVSLAASTGLIGVSLSDLSLYVDIRDDDGEGRQAGDGVVYQVVLTEGPLREPTLHRRGASDVGVMTIDFDGQRVSARGTFDDHLTPDVVEEVAGAIEADCGTIIGDVVAPSEAPAEADGSVTVGGTTYEFSFGDPPRCNIPGQDGRVGSRPFLVGDPDSQVTFSYATAEMSASGTPSMQIIIPGPDGSQLWYSAVGILPTDVGSIDDIEVEGNTVRISGSLRDGSDRTIRAEFTAEATCDA